MSAWRRPRGFDLRRVTVRCEVAGHVLEVWHAERVGNYFQPARRYVLRIDGKFVGDAATVKGAKLAAVLVLLDWFNWSIDE